MAKKRWSLTFSNKFGRVLVDGDESVAMRRGRRRRQMGEARNIRDTPRQVDME